MLNLEFLRMRLTGLSQHWGCGAGGVEEAGPWAELVHLKSGPRDKVDSRSTGLSTLFHQEKFNRLPL